MLHIENVGVQILHMIYSAGLKVFFVVLDFASMHCMYLSVQSKRFFRGFFVSQEPVLL